MKATIIDIARAAQVSKATVDRVLNERPGVRPVVRQKVLQAAMQLGYLATSNEVAMPARPARLEFILPVGTSRFLRDVARHLDDFCSRLPLVESCRVLRLETASVDEFLTALDELGERTEGLGIVSVDNPRTRSAVSRVIESGVPVVTIASDLPSSGRADYIGIDNRAAGRTAGLLMGQMLSPARRNAAIFLGSRSYRGHEEREAGFRSIVSESFADIEIGATIEIADDNRRAFDAAQALFTRQPDIGGIYCAGGGRSGILRAMEERYGTGEVRPKIFCHDLTGQTRRALLTGTLDLVIDQNARLMAEQAVIHLLGALATSAPFLTKKLIEPRLITRENIPAYLGAADDDE